MNLTLQISAHKDDAVYTGWLKDFPNIVAEGKDENELKEMLLIGLKKAFQEGWSKHDLPSEKRTAYTRLSLGMASIHVNNHVAELIWRVQDAMAELGGKFSLDDATKIEVAMADKYKRNSHDYDALIEELKTHLEKKETKERIEALSEKKRKQGN